jgi:cytochrome b pre-mRNA-processing protein 3
MRFLDRLFSATRDPRDEVRALWRAVVEQARAPEWYHDGGVADTLEGRFDMVTMTLALVVLRMERSEVLAPQTAPLTEIFVEEMDGQLRQSGVGDLMVGKQIGRLMATLGGRMGALRTALAASVDAVEDVVRRNVTLREDADVEAIATRLSALAARLDAIGDAGLLAGEIV